MFKHILKIKKIFNKRVLKTNKIDIRVRYGETDQMGVVHHSNYIKYMELARIEWLRQLGASYKNMEQQGVILPVVSLNVNYKKSAFFDDVLTIKTELSKMPTVRIEFDYEIYNQNNELLATANTVLAFVNMETKKPIRCPDYILKKLLD